MKTEAEDNIILFKVFQKKTSYPSYFKASTFKLKSISLVNVCNLINETTCYTMLLVIAPQSI